MAHTEYAVDFRPRTANAVLPIGTAGFHTTCPGAELEGSSGANDMNLDRRQSKHLLALPSEAAAMVTTVLLLSQTVG